MLAPAKINLYLGVHPGVDEFGYHTIDTVMHPISLADNVELSLSHTKAKNKVQYPKISLVCNKRLDVSMDQNIAFKAASNFCEAFDHNISEINIELEKNIPTGAGLGGGSSDAAAVLRALAADQEIDLKNPALLNLASNLGADVPFFLYSVPLYMDGYGDHVVKKLNSAQGEILLIKPEGSIATQEAYQTFDELQTEPASSLDKLLDAMSNKRDYHIEELESYFSNNLEESAKVLLPKIDNIFSLISQYGFRPHMTGSGSTVFAVIPNEGLAQRKAEELVKIAKKFGHFAHISKLLHKNS